MTRKNIFFIILGISLIFLVTPFFVQAQEVTSRNVVRRDTFSELSKSAHIAFMGGSITEMDGYRPMVCEMLRERFPETEFTFTAAGIASTCSTTGAFRLERDVLSQGPVDMFFVEFAVNDDQDAHHSREAAIRGMEGIVRHVLRHNPRAKIVMTFFANEHLMEEYRRGAEAVSIAAHREVAERYGISTVNVAREAQQQIDEKTLTWERFGGVHPAPYGNRLTANMIAYLLDDSAELSESVAESENPLEPFCYENGRFLSPETAEFSGAWTWSVPDWTSLPGAFRSNFAGLKLLCCQTPEEEMMLEFTGSAIGAYILAGPDAGIVEYRVDDLPAQQATLFHDFSSGLHYPRTVIFHDDLPPGMHILRMKLIETVPPGSKGTAARILEFTVNPE